MVRYLEIKHVGYARMRRQGRLSVTAADGIDGDVTITAVKNLRDREVFAKILCCGQGLLWKSRVAEKI